jgi:hypothetical protein
VSAVLLVLLVGHPVPAETLRVRTVDRLPAPSSAAAVLGRPTLQLAGGRVRLWLARGPDKIGVYVVVRDSTRSVRDEVVVSLDVDGDAAPMPQHDDFQWQLRRVLDSTVVRRGRGGRWQPPRDDPEWRLGEERGGGGWEVDAADTADGWCVLLRLHPAMLAGEAGRLPGMAFRIYDGEPGGWHAWPEAQQGAHPTSVERTPSRWARVH